uniref:hypothetical protein n=1 Tax=Alistipes shahii TaxID=328814 RepID=UPI003FEF7D5F
HARCPRPDDDHVVRPDFFFFDLFHTAAKIDNNSFFPEKFFLSLRPKKTVLNRYVEQKITPYKGRQGAVRPSQIGRG